MSEHLFMLSLSFTLCRYFVLVVVTCCVIAVGIVCGSYLYSRFLTFIISKMLDKCVIHAAVHFNDNMTLKWFVCTPSVRVEQLFWISLCEDPFCWNCFEVESVDCFIAVVLHPYTWKLPKHFLYLSTRCMYNLDNITMMGLGNEMQVTELRLWIILCNLIQNYISCHATECRKRWQRPGEPTPWHHCRPYNHQKELVWLLSGEPACPTGMGLRRCA